jgi:molybdate transport system substrate-binding protein
VRRFERLALAPSELVAAEYANIGALTERLRKGEAADVAIVSAQQNEELQKLGKIVLGSHIDIARVGISLIVRSGAPKPDISSAEAFKKTLLLAKSIIYGDPAAGGPSGLYLANLIERLGIAAEIKPKTKLSGAGENLFEAVAKGEVELGLENTTSLAQRPGIDIVGPVPPEFQSYTVYSAGILTSSAQQEAAKTLVTFLVSPSSKSVLKARGFEPL